MTTELHQTAHAHVQYDTDVVQHLMRLCRTVYPDADSYGFLPVKLNFSSAQFSDVSVTSDMSKISPASTNT